MKINTYDQNLTMNIAWEPTFTSAPPASDSSMCIQVDFKISSATENAYYTTDGSNMVYQCDPVPDSNLGSTGKSSFILNRVVYDSVDEKIIPQKSFLNELNTIIPSNRYFNLYYTTSSSNEMIFYYFDNNQNRITITKTFNAAPGKTSMGQIIVKLFSFNVYLRRIVNTCPFNGILATNNSFCASNNDKLGLQQYYVIKFKNRDNENFEQFKNRPIRFFQNYS